MISEDLLHDLRVISIDDPDSRQLLYKAACSSLNLSVMDYQTVRDLVGHASGKRPGRDHLPLEAVLIAMFAAIGRGDLCLDMSSTASAKWISAMPPESTVDFQDLLSKFDPTEYDDLVCRLDVDDLRGQAGDGGGNNCKILRDQLRHKPLAAIYSNGECRYIYFNRNLRQALVIKERLCGSGNDDYYSEATDQTVVQAVVDSSTIKLDTGQIDALRLGLKKRLSVITGGPGTGKTSIVFAILRCLLRMGYDSERIALAAPTGRAAQRMTESLRKAFAELTSKRGADAKDAAVSEMKGSTLHRLLKYNPSRNCFTYNSDNPIPADVIIVDEVSMVDAEMMAFLLGAVDKKTKLIFLGDADQLPSVEAGGIFAELCGAPEDDEVLARVARLTENHRSNQDILSLARAVQGSGEATRMLDSISVLAPDPIRKDADGGPLLEVKWPTAGTSPSCLRIDCIRDRSDWEGLMRSWVKHCYFDSNGDQSYVDRVKAFAHLEFAHPDAASLTDHLDRLDGIFRGIDRARILTLVREGRQGCDSINRLIARKFSKQFDYRAKGHIFSGAPIIITANDHSRELYNGDVGVILRDRSGVHRAFFKRADRYVEFAPDMLPPHELAFAITVHKSQGSEYDNVFLVFPDNTEDGRTSGLMTREMFYTGATRAKDTVTLYASTDVLHSVCSQSTQRNNGMSLWKRDEVCQGCTFL